MRLGFEIKEDIVEIQKSPVFTPKPKGNAPASKEKCELYITNIAFETDEGQLTDHF